MITTIIHNGPGIDKMGKALEQFGPIGVHVEKVLELPKGHHLNLTLSGMTISGLIFKTRLGNPVAHFFLTAPCEIVSFENEKSTATRVVKELGQFIVSNDDGTFRFENEESDRTAEETIGTLLSVFEK